MPNLNNLTTQDLQWGTANWSGQGYIEGLKMVWNSATSISVTSGAAFIPSLSKNLPVPATLTLTGLALTPSTFYHVYLYLNAGVAAIECVTTAPAAPYYGTARTKTGDTSRRYIGSVYVDASSNIINFTNKNNKIEYLKDLGLQVLSSGTATTDTSVSLASFCPLTATKAKLSVDNSPSSGVSVFIGVPAVPRLAAFYTGTVNVYESEIDSSQSISYRYASAPTSGGLAIRVLGYSYER